MITARGGGGTKVSLFENSFVSQTLRNSKNFLLLPLRRGVASGNICRKSRKHESTYFYKQMQHDQNKEKIALHNIVIAGTFVILDNVLYSQNIFALIKVLLVSTSKTQTTLKEKIRKDKKKKKKKRIKII